MRFDALVEDLRVIIITRKSSNNCDRECYVKSTVGKIDSCFKVKIWSNDVVRLQVARRLILTWLVQRLDEHNSLCHKYSCESVFEPNNKRDLYVY